MLDIGFQGLIARVITLVVAFSVHEFAHAWTADYFGDDTPRSQGRLTLNPLVHLDPLGSLMLVVAGFGWAKPVMINPYALRQRSEAAPMLVALAGPASNFLMAIAASIPAQAGLIEVWGAGFLSLLLREFVLINLLLMLFNLIPVSPLDGEKIITYFLPPAGQTFFKQIRPYGSMILLALIFVLPSLGINVLQSVIVGPMRLLFNLLLGQV
jgi:Zn-dependent protease